MPEFTDEYIMYLIDKYRDYFIVDIENSMCLDCYNLTKDLKLSENDVEVIASVCKLCKKQKLCIKHLK